MYKQFGLLIIGVISIFGLIAIISMKDTSSQQYDQLPWQITAKQQNVTHVFGLNVGSDSLEDAINTLRHMPEIAFFDDGKEKLTEAFFGSVKVGALLAKVLMEVDHTPHYLENYTQFKISGEPMPSGKRKYKLGELAIKAANKLTVWKLVYIPSVNYEQNQLEQFFGKPALMETIKDDVQYWQYPDKGLVVEYNPKGGEIFYYSSRKDYHRMFSSLPR